MEKIILFIYLLLFSVQSFGSVLVSGEFNEPLKPHSVFYNDTTGKLYLDEIKKKKFDKINPGGFYKGNVWAKVEICNPNNEVIHINEIYDSGFKNIYLCTGFAPGDFKANQYLLGIKGKEPFWEEKL